MPRTATSTSPSTFAAIKKGEVHHFPFDILLRDPFAVTWSEEWRSNLEAEHFSPASCVPARGGSYSSRVDPELPIDLEAQGRSPFGATGNAVESNTPRLSCGAPILRSNFLH
jgi:hypothetical protein